MDYSLGGYDTTGTTFDLTATSQSGDKFYFVINALSEDTADNTVFDPMVELLHPEGAEGPAPTRWPEVVVESKDGTLPPGSTQPPAATLCFEPRLRHYEDHKGCCAEIGGLVYNAQGKPYGPRGATLHIEGPPATDRYVRDFGVDASGGYGVTAAYSGPVHDLAEGSQTSAARSTRCATRTCPRIRIIVDFYQVACK